MVAPHRGALPLVLLAACFVSVAAQPDVARAVALSDAPDDATSLVQAHSRRVKAPGGAPGASGPRAVFRPDDAVQAEPADARTAALRLSRSAPPSALLSLIPREFLSGRAASNATKQAIVDRIAEEIDGLVQAGLWTRAVPRVLLAGCGKASFHELGMSIELWKESHPNVDPYCHFGNYVWWWSGIPYITDYREHGRKVFLAQKVFEQSLCEYLGDSGGPARSFRYVAGGFEWAHVDGCIDVVDDPYCYSLGWLKGQRLDGVNMSDVGAWRAKGQEECRRIQDTYHFVDEEVTVGNHVFNYPLMLHSGAMQALGKGPPPDQRIFNQAVYTHCLLDDALEEMAYCYYRGCVLPDGRVSHGGDCGYD